MKTMDWNTGIIIGIYLLLLAGGIALCFRGLKLYKVLQFFLCGGVGYYLGTLLLRKWGAEQFYIIPILFAVFLGCLGYRYYKLGLYVGGAAGGFVVVFSYFWSQAVELLKDGIGGLSQTKILLMDCISDILSGIAPEASMASFAEGQTTLLMQDINMALDILQKGILYAGLAGVLAGVLVLIFGDFVIMLVTAALGATILIMFVEIFVFLAPTMHLCGLIGVTVAGLIAQGTGGRR